MRQLLINSILIQKLQRVMDEDSENSDNEQPETVAEDSDSDLPSDFEKEMAVDEDDEEEEEEEDENEEKLQKDIVQHKKDMEALKERDPEFYNFLQKEDDGLLGFGESDDEDEPEQIGGSDDDEGAYSDMEEPEEEKEVAVHVLTKTELNEWIDAIKSNKDFKAFKKLLSAFKTAARMSEEDDSVTFAFKIEDPTGKMIYRIFFVYKSKLTFR